MEKYLFVSLLALFFAIMACLPKEPGKTIQRTDQYYEIIKTVVTDEAISDLLTPDQIEDIHQVDESYKSLRKLALKIEDSKNDIQAMAQCGIAICDILAELDIDDRQKKEIAAIRLGIKMFMATLAEPDIY
jgi:hypothetical protein